MKIHNFITKEFETTQPYCSVDSIKKQLLKNKAIVVKDKKDVLYGVLTPLDIIRRPHNLVIDCLTIKPELSLYDDIEKALEIMVKAEEDVLPIFEKNNLEGLIHKNDIVEFLTQEKKTKEKIILEQIDLFSEISWMHSHKLRSPVASILGLINILDKSTLTESNKEIIYYLEQQAILLDTVIHTLVDRSNS